MIDYGKVAFNKVNDLFRNRQESFNFCSKTISFNLTENNLEYKITVNAKNTIYFALKSSEVTSVRVLVNGRLEYVNNSFINTNFELYIQDKSEIVFKFLNLTNAININLIVQGLFNFVNDAAIKLIPLNNNLAIVNKTSNTFSYYKSDSVENTVSLFNSGGGLVFDYNFLSMCEVNGNVLCLAEKNNKFYILENMQNAVMLQQDFTTKAKILRCNLNGDGFLIVDVKNGKLNLKAYSLTYNLLFEFSDLVVAEINNISIVNEVYNYINNNIYFTVSDANNNCYVVLCNINNSGLIKPEFNVVNIGKLSELSGVVNFNNQFYFSCKTNLGVKTIIANINFENRVLTITNTENLNNVSGVLILNDLKVINYQGNLCVS